MENAGHEEPGQDESRPDGQGAQAEPEADRPERDSSLIGQTGTRAIMGTMARS